MSNHEHRNDTDETMGKRAFQIAFAFVLISLLLLSTGYARAAVIFTETEGVRTKWGEQTLGTGADVSWSLIDTGTSCWVLGAGCTFTGFNDVLSTGWESILQDAFNAWESIANINFTQVEDGGEAFNAGGTSGQIRLGAREFDGRNGVLARAWYPLQDGAPLGGDIHLDVDELWAVDDDDLGFDLFQVFTHEIGHAIGFEHTADRNALMFPWYHERTRGPQEYERQIAAQVYGPRDTFEVGNEQYSDAVSVDAPSSSVLFAFALVVMALRLKPKYHLLRKEAL